MVLGIANDMLLSVAVLVASGAHILASASEKSGARSELSERKLLGGDPMHASMESNELGMRMMELVNLTNRLEENTEKVKIDAGETIKMKEEKKTKLLDVTQLLEEKKREKVNLDKKISDFAEEVRQIEKEYFALLGKTKELGND